MLPSHTNNTCDVYRAGNAPPAAPDVAGVACTLRPFFPAGFEFAEADVTFNVTHVMEVELGADIRDNASAFGPGGDKVYVPDKNGTRFRVVGVIRTSYGTPNDRRRVYLYREAVTYPTNFL
ncbi:MAG: hypothetical protein L0Y72_19955 [Gemmataceae bacterium]|nr:hypothetical protein [Gemmataceae bacterium]MCI0741311.1 hypothetical protein [Gemmataceae bacterium]